MRSRERLGRHFWCIGSTFERLGPTFERNIVEKFVFVILVPRVGETTTFGGPGRPSWSHLVHKVAPRRRLGQPKWRSGRQKKAPGQVSQVDLSKRRRKPSESGRGGAPLSSLRSLSIDIDELDYIRFITAAQRTAGLRTPAASHRPSPFAFHRLGFDRI